MMKFDGEGPSVTLTIEEEPPEVPLSSRALPVLSPAGLISSRRMTAGRTVSLSPSFPSPLVRRYRGTPQSRAFRKTFFPDAADQQWNDWRWQSRNRIRTLAQLESMLILADEERGALLAGGSMLPMSITPYYMSLISRDDPQQPLRRTVIPTSAEMARAPGEADDPLGEDQHSPVPGLVHRYPDRVLLLVLDFCSTYCRYCTRSRVVGHGEILPTEARIEKALQYIRQTPEIRDVLLSGGDPLALSEERLDWILTRLREIPHVEFVRLGTKMPAVLPQRITPQLCRVLRKFHPLWMSLHFTPRVRPGVRPVGRRRHPSGLADGAAAGHQRQRPDDEGAGPPAALDAGAAVLSLPVRPDLRLVALPHLGGQGPGDYRRVAGPHDRVCRADLCDRRSRRRRKDPAPAELRRRAGRRRPAAAKLRKPDVSLSGPGRRQVPMTKSQ